jgi:arsenite-transporting ATPase
MINRIIGIPMPGEDVFDAGEELFARLEHMRALLADPDKTSVRVVLTLEQVVIKEAQRSFTYFHLYGYPTDLVVTNRVLPERAWEYFRGWYEAQQRYTPLVERTFAPIPIMSAPYLDHELVGIEALAELAAAIYGDRDPTEFFYRGRPYRVTREDGEYLLSIELPFASREQIHLSRHGDELMVDLGSWRRTLVLPRVLIDAPTHGARFENHTLQIRFGTSEAAHGGGTHG